MSGIFDKTTQSLGAALNMRLLKHNVTSANIANAETPGYKAMQVEFEDALSRSLDIDGLRTLSTTSEDHIPVGGGSISKVRAGVFENPNGAVSNDGNSVDMEKEMATMAENTTLYKTALSLINKKLAALKYAATEGR